MHPLVRDLYKRIVFTGRDYPLGLDWVRGKAKAWIQQNANISNEVELKKKVAEGRFWVREMQSVIALRKYRYLKKKYNTDARNQ